MPSTAAPGFAWLRLASARSSAEDEELLPAALNRRAASDGQAESLLTMLISLTIPTRHVEGELSLGSALARIEGSSHLGDRPVERSLHSLSLREKESLSA
jgi:hypothetical protein